MSPRTLPASRIRIKAGALPRLLLSSSASALIALVLPAGAGAQQNLSGNDILQHLNTALTWYRDTRSPIQTVGLPSDAVFASDMQVIASEVTIRAFESAKAEAALLSTFNSSTQGTAIYTGAGTPDYAKLSNEISARNSGIEKQLDTVESELNVASGRKATELAQQRDRLQGELDLGKTMLSTVNQMAQFIGTTGEGGSTALESSIGQLARTVPELTAAAGKKQPQAPISSNIQAISDSTGLLGQATALYDLSRTLHQIDQLQHETEHVEALATQLRDPLRQLLRTTLQQGQALSDQAAQMPAVPAISTAAHASSPKQPAPTLPSTPTKKDFDTLSAHFEQIAAAEMPLNQEIILLEQAKANLSNWDSSIDREYEHVLGWIVTRVIAIAVALGFLLLLSEIWRRMTLRYIRDMRRRRQFLLVRRFVIGFCMGLVIILGFVSEFSSLATFAGFLTAGIAVGLQTILLSVAAYFFIIGRYGIRVGDRISIAGITGDVIDVGLVRLYLMELGGTGVDLYPTGRLAVLSNAVLFQATVPLFKQVPGTDYVWHEAAVLLSPGADARAVQERLLAVVMSIVESYRQELERQHLDVQKRIDIQVAIPSPQAHLEFIDAGLEASVRYPVPLRRISETDDKVTRALAEMAASEEPIKGALAGVPKIRAAVKG